MAGCLKDERMLGMVLERVGRRRSTRQKNSSVSNLDGSRRLFAVDVGGSGDSIAKETLIIAPFRQTRRRETCRGSAKVSWL